MNTVAHCSQPMEAGTAANAISMAAIPSVYAMMTCGCERNQTRCQVNVAAWAGQPHVQSSPSPLCGTPSLGSPASNHAKMHRLPSASGLMVPQQRRNEYSTCPAEGCPVGRCAHLHALAHVAAAALGVVDEHVGQLAGQQRAKQPSQLQARHAQRGGAGVRHALNLQARRAGAQFQ